MSTLNSALTTDQRLTWVDPTIVALDVAETASNANTGNDAAAGTRPDQTKS